MKKIMSSLAQYFGNVPAQVRNKKILVLLLTLAITVLCGYGLGDVKFDMTIEGWFSQDDPTMIAFDEFHAQFGSEDGVYIVYKPKEGDVFSAKALEAVKGIQHELLNSNIKLGDVEGTEEFGEKDKEESPLEHIVKITSLINVPVLTVEGDVLRSRQLVGEKVPTSSEALDKIKKTALSQKSFPLQYFSKDLTFGGMNIDTDFGAIPWDADQQSEDLTMDDMSFEDSDAPEPATTRRFKPTDMADYDKLWRVIKHILNKKQYADHLEYYAVGNTPASEADNAMVSEMGDLYMAALLIMIVLLWLLFRSFSAVVWPLVIVILSTVWTIGITGLLGLTITAFVILTVFLLLTVGMADSVHILSGYLFFRNQGQDHISSMTAAFKKAGIACLLTSLTTMIGLAALFFSDIIPVKIFAFMSVIGVAIAFFLSIYVLPVLLELWPPVTKKVKDPRQSPGFFARILPDFATAAQKLLDKVVPVVERRPATYIVLFLTIFLICVFGVLKIKIGGDLLDSYPDDSFFTRSVHVIDDKMAGSSRMVIFLDLGRDYAFQDPDVLNVIDDLQRKIEKKYSRWVVMTSSLVEVVKDASQKLNEGRSEMYAIPTDSKVLSQTLFMFNNVNSEDRMRLVDDHYRKANIAVSLLNGDAYDYNIMFNDMQKDINDSMNLIRQKYPETQVSITGIFALAMKAADYLTATALRSFGIALIVISIVLLLVYGTLKAGLISFLPNLIPSFLTFGLLGLLDIRLDFYTMMLAPIVIGISVDDTIHFMTHYRLQVSVDGDINKALRLTLKEAGQGILFTTLVLGIGFSILAVASAAGTSNMGKFGALAVFMGLMNDLFFLPALIMTFKLKFSKD